MVPLKTCIVSYTDCDYRRSVEVMAETLNEAAVLGLKATPKKVVFPRFDLSCDDQTGMDLT